MLCFSFCLFIAFASILLLVCGFSVCGNFGFAVCGRCELRRGSIVLSGPCLNESRRFGIRAKSGSLVGNMASQGPTPRQLTDLIGSLSDLTSGSGDKGTPIVLIQGYFDNYTD